MSANLNGPSRRERWTEALVLEARTSLQAELASELAEYLDRPEDEVLADCSAGARTLAESWRDVAPEGAKEISEFYKNTYGYLYDLTWWHSLAEDESALAGVEALEAALDRRVQKVLDFGSGIGSLGLLFATHGLDVTLAEINPMLNDYARWRFTQRGLQGRFLDMGLEVLPENAFDFISAVDVLEHLPDPHDVLLSLASALRPEGAIFIHLPVETDPLRPMHLWHGPQSLLRHLDEAGLWLESVTDSTLVLRKGEAPRYALRPGLQMLPVEEGGVLLSKMPLSATRINPQAMGLLSSLEDPLTASEVTATSGVSLTHAVGFLDTLTERRVIAKTHPDHPVRWPSVTVVVPSRNRPQETRRCVESLLSLDYPGELLEVIVADDASSPPLAPTLVGLPVRTLRLETNVGQSAARNAAVEAARGEIIAFTDSDCVVDTDWLRSLVPWLCRPGVDAVGGRVLALEADDRVAAFEAVRSSLDMGATAGRVGAEEAVPYLPTCNLAVDRELLLRLGGFKEDMRLGEDADLVWRALRAGSGVRYEPEAEITHEHRTSLGSLLRRRSDYGSSEADLQLRHREAQRSVTVPGVVTALLAALSASIVYRRAGLGLATLAGLALGRELLVKSRQLRSTGVELPARQILAAISRQHGAGLYHLSSNVTRYYGLPLLGASLLWRPLLPPVLTLLLVPPAVDHYRQRPKLGAAAFAGLYWLELAAYQVGVWKGCLKRKTTKPLLARLRFSR